MFEFVESRVYSKILADKKIKTFSDKFNPNVLKLFLEKRLSPRNAVEKIFFSP